METTTVYVRASRARVLRILYSVPQTAKQGGPADGILSRAGVAALNRIERAFIAKSTGGTDETGARWTPLAPSTIAKKARKRNPTGDRYRPSAALNPAQRELWWNLYRSALAKFKDKSTAAKVAWSRLKRSIGAIRFDKYGTASLILRDIEALLRSLQPGAIHSIFRLSPGELELGTDRKGAKAHHFGAANLPQRRLWPEPQDWTSAWWQEILVAARTGLIELIVEELK